VRPAEHTRPRLALAAYFIAVFAASSLTDWRELAGLLALLFIVFFRDALPVSKRVALLVGPFLLVTTIATIAYWRWADGAFERWGLVATFNLRAALLASLTFVFVRRVNLFAALSFSRTLTTVLTIAMAQIQLHRRLVQEFAQVLRSRTITRPGAGGTLRAAAVISGSLLGQSLSQGKETADALRSRRL
jgi:cobalt/nickel transport system permease protein